MFSQIEKNDALESVPGTCRGKSDLVEEEEASMPHNSRDPISSAEDIIELMIGKKALVKKILWTTADPVLRNSSFLRRASSMILCHHLVKQGKGLLSSKGLLLLGTKIRTIAMILMTKMSTNVKRSTQKRA